MPMTLAPLLPLWVQDAYGVGGTCDFQHLLEDLELAVRVRCCLNMSSVRRQRILKRLSFHRRAPIAPTGISLLAPIFLFYSAPSHRP